MKKILLGLVILLFLFFVWFFSQKPSNSRAWTKDQTQLPFADIDGDLITIHNIRNNAYRTTDDFDVVTYDKTVDLKHIERVDYIVEPFSNWGGPAHTFLTFGFAGATNTEYLALSVEIRKEQGESFSPWKGLLRQYEIMYVAGDERDLIGLRTNYRHDNVYLYPIRTTKERIRALFLSMIERMNTLYEHPEFYNTLTSTCTTNIQKHVNEIFPGRVPLSYKILLPGYSDELAYTLGLIDAPENISIEDLRTRFRINEKAERFADDPLFSQKIRE